MSRPVTFKACASCGGAVDPRFNLHKECLDRTMSPGDVQPALILTARGEARAERDRARTIIAAVAALHHKETRWHPPNHADGSWDSAEEAALWDDQPVDDMESFDVCAECARIELGDDGCGVGYYLESLWPCTTAKAITVQS